MEGSTILNGTTKSTPRPSPARDPAGNCPDCGTAYGKRRRCYRGDCPSGSPGRKRPGSREDAPAEVVAAPREAEATAAVPSRPEDVLREIDAMRRVVEALEHLSDVEARRVLAWVGSRHWG